MTQDQFRGYVPRIRAQLPLGEALSTKQSQLRVFRGHQRPLDRAKGFQLKRDLPKSCKRSVDPSKIRGYQQSHLKVSPENQLRGIQLHASRPREVKVGKPGHPEEAGLRGSLQLSPPLHAISVSGGST